MFLDYFTLSFKNLKHRGIRSWLTLLGIFIGVASVIALMSLGAGLQLAVSSQFGISATELITVQAGGVSGYGPPGSFVVTPLDTDDMAAIGKLNSVERSVRRNVGSVKIEYNDIISFQYAASVPNGDDRKFIYEQLDGDPLLGRFLKDADSKKVFLGYNFYAKKEDWGKEIVPGKNILINEEKFEVVGILEKKGSFIFDNAVFMNEDELLDLMDSGDNVDAILVQPKDKEKIDQTKADVEKLLRDRRDVKLGEEDFEVSTPEASMATVNSVLNGVQVFIILVASISIFIGSLGIVNTMTTSVLERRKEIGIMKAIGARNRQVFFQFFVESGLLGLIGGLVGVIFGTLLGLGGIYGLNSFLGTDLKFAINYLLTFWALFGSFAIGALAGIVPAMNAAKQNPVEALRG